MSTKQMARRQSKLTSTVSIRDAILLQQFELEFRRGYYRAVSNLITGHKDSGVQAVETLRAYGNTDFTGVDPDTVKILKRLLRSNGISYRK